jgi:hypothetical protein
MPDRSICPTLRPTPYYYYITVHDWPARRVETARISLECTPDARIPPDTPMRRITVHAQDR